MKKRKTYRNPCSLISHVVCVFGLIVLCLFSSNANAYEKSEDIQVQLSRQTNTIYNILNQITRQTGYFFIYDSEIIDSDKEVRIGRTQKCLMEFLRELAPDPSLEFKIIENHILILSTAEEKVEEKPLEEPDEKVDSPIILKGRIFDSKSGEPLPYSAIVHKNSKTGVIANENGIFKFRLAEKFINDSIEFSIIGYRALTIPVSILKHGFADIGLEFQTIYLQEFTIKYFEPLPILQKALSKIEHNYPDQPTNHLSFYREGVFIEGEAMYYSESVIKEYKPSYGSHLQDRMTLLQSRSISNINREDTLVFKLKAGLQSSVQMDLVRNMSDFLDSQLIRYYNFSPAGMVYLNNSFAYAIDFEQKDNIREALYKGTIYIEEESFAIVSIDFEINRNHIRDVQSRFIPRPSSNYVINIQSAEYKVSYNLHEDRFHLNHLKGELNLRARDRKKLLGRSYRIFFEKGTMHVETENVQPLRIRETINKNIVLSEKNFEYDYDFWGGHNIIVPEKEISDALNEISVNIENIIYE